MCVEGERFLLCVLRVLRGPDGLTWLCSLWLSTEVKIWGFGSCFHFLLCVQDNELNSLCVAFLICKMGIATLTLLPGYFEHPVSSVGGTQFSAWLQ